MSLDTAVAIISQARMTSSRLPGKVLKLAGGKTLLEHHFNRLKTSGLPVIVATTRNSSDDPIVSLCERLQVKYSRGDENDVLSRYYEAAEKYHLSQIIRVTSDCPLIDGDLIQKAWKRFVTDSQLKPHFYLSNCLKRTFPRGFDFEIFHFEDLKKAFLDATLVSDREHVTPFIHQNRSGKIQMLSVENETDDSRFRLTVDEADDFELIKTLIEQFHAEKLSAREIISILKTNPKLAEINSHVEQKKL
jgi:spore coat polysaccharide biosynthesis protein SpsF